MNAFGNPHPRVKTMPLISCNLLCKKMPNYLSRPSPVCLCMPKSARLLPAISCPTPSFRSTPRTRSKEKDGQKAKESESSKIAPEMQPCSSTDRIPRASRNEPCVLCVRPRHSSGFKGLDEPSYSVESVHILEWVSFLSHVYPFFLAV